MTTEKVMATVARLRDRLTAAGTGNLVVESKEPSVLLMVDAANSLPALLDVLEAWASLLADCEGHITELADAWERGRISEHDGKGGTRSNRNWGLMIRLQRERLK